jgi:hypothetical protein
MEDPPVAVGRFQGGAQAGRRCDRIPSPACSSRSTQEGAWLTSSSTASGSQSPAPAARVSRVWLARLSSGPVTAAIPPWAQRLAEGRTVMLAEKEHPQTRRQLQAGHQPGGPAADHHDIPLREQRMGTNRPSEPGFRSDAETAREVTDSLAKSRPIKGGWDINHHCPEGASDEPQVQDSAVDTVIDSIEAFVEGDGWR